MDWIGTKAVTARTHTPTIFSLLHENRSSRTSCKNQVLQQLSGENLPPTRPTSRRILERDKEDKMGWTRWDTVDRTR
jgi:hypothetical protein